MGVILKSRNIKSIPLYSQPSFNLIILKSYLCLSRLADLLQQASNHFPLALQQNVSQVWISLSSPCWMTVGKNVCWYKTPKLYNDTTHMRNNQYLFTHVFPCYVTALWNPKLQCIKEQIIAKHQIQSWVLVSLHCETSKLLLTWDWDEVTWKWRSGHVPQTWN